VQARSIFADIQADDRTAHVAVVAWLGYHPPDSIDLNAIRETRAQEGAEALVAFVHGLLRQRPEADVTLVGHSYGSIVVGIAAASLPEVRDVVVLGTPGMGVDSASELPGTRVWSALVDGDWIRRGPEVRVFGLGHGRRPSSPGFGATALPTAGVSEHDGYLAPGTATLDAVARVVLDRSGR
jgi:pimeloyl-ACP methyl ester carboxylesterase